MAFQLTIKEEAKRDILKGFLWYEAKQNGLGVRFVNDVEASIQFVEMKPRAFQIKNKYYREAVLSTFPYVVIYELNKLQITVYAIFPTKDDPSKKPK